MEGICSLIGFGFQFVSIFVFFAVLGGLTKHDRHFRRLGVFLAVLALLFVAPDVFPFSLVASLAGYIVGVVARISPTLLRRGYLVALVTALISVAFDLLYESGIARFGIPSFDSLTDSQLCYFVVTESFSEALITALAVAVCFGLLSGFLRFVIRDAHRRILVTTILTTFVMYLIEPQLHLRIRHPLLVHHPFFCLSTGLGLVLGVWGAGKGLLPHVPLCGEDRPFTATVVYFAFYHFVVTVGEHTSGWMSHVAYGATMRLTLIITFPFGVMLFSLWSRRKPDELTGQQRGIP